MRIWPTAGLLLSLPLAALAQTGPIEVQHAWSRPAMAGHTGVIYLTITDHGAPDRLVGVASPAGRAELHESFDDHGVMKMRAVQALPVAPGTSVALKPGGYHIMLMDLKHDLNAGDSVPVTLKFAKAGQVKAMAMVEKNAAAGTQHGDMGGMKMK
jgi:copper(I)-binding protein